MPAYDLVKGKETASLSIRHIRKYYMGKKIDQARINDAAAGFKGDKPYNISHFYRENEHKIEIEYTYRRSYSGEETNYETSIMVDAEGKIVSVEPLHASRYCFSDVARDGYKTVRAGDFDYFIFDLLLSYSCNE